MSDPILPFVFCSDMVRKGAIRGPRGRGLILRALRQASRYCRCALFPAAAGGILLFAAAPLLAQTSQWRDVQEQDGVAYLLRPSPAQIMRYDLDAAEWLEPVPLDEVPSAFAVEGDYFFIASGRKLERIDADGANKVHIANTADDIHGLLTDGNLLFANRSTGSYARFTSFDMESLEKIAEFEKYIDSLQGASIAPSLNKLFGAKMSGSPRDISYVLYEDDGTFVQGGRSPYHGRYTIGGQTWVFPDESKMVDSSGTVYNAVDLTYNNSFGVTLTDIAFHGVDVPIVLAEGVLISYSNTLLETGRFSLSLSARRLLVHEGKAYAFQENENAPTKVSVEIVNLTELEVREPGEAISPDGLAYTIDDSAIDADGVLYLLSKSFSSVFRWDGNEQEYLETIPLPESADRIVYSGFLNRLYIYAPSRKVYRIDLDDGAPAAVHHLTAPLHVNTLIPLGPELMVLQNGSWESQWVYDSEGSLLKAHVSCCYHNYHFYDETSEYLYYDSYRVPYQGAGILGTREGSRISSFSPLALSQDGQFIVDGQGTIYGTSSGPSQIDSLSNDVTRAVWNSAGRLFTFKSEVATDSVMVQKWSEYYVIEAERRFVGTPLRLYSHEENIIVVTEVDGIPRFAYLDADLNAIPPSSLATPSLAIAKYSATAATLEWEWVMGAEDYVIERKLSTDDDWTVIATEGSTATRFTDVTLVAGSIYEFRMKATNGDLESEYSAVVDVDLVGIADERADPRELSFVPDDVLISSDDVIYMLSGEQQSIFAWDTVIQDWSPTIPLEGAASRFTYSPDNNALYTLYSDDALYSIGLAAANPVEIHFAQVPTGIRPGLVAAGEFIIAGRAYSYDASGIMVDHRSHSYAFNDGVWNPVRRNIYHLRDGTSPNDLISTHIQADGKFGSQTDSPYHSSGMGWRHPVRADPDGTIVIIGSGLIFNAVSLQQVGTLAGSILDAAWVDGTLVTLADNIVYSHSADTYGATPEIELVHSGLRLLATNDGRLAVVSETASGDTVVDIYNAETFEISPPAVLAQPEGLRGRIDAANRVTLFWKRIAGASGYQVERRTGDAAVWEPIGSTGAGITAFEDNEVESDGFYEYRVIAFNADLVSEASEVMGISVSAPEAPGDFTASAVDGFRIDLEWTIAVRADSYRLEKRVDGSLTWNLVQVLDAHADAFADTGLTPDTAYEFRIRASNPLGTSDWVNASAKTEAVPPQTPILDFPQATPVSVTLSWSPAAYAKEIVVERSAEGGVEWLQLAVLPSSQATYTDESVQPSSTYVYRIKARNDAGESNYSMERSVTTPALPPPPAPPMGHPYPDTANSLLLTWHEAAYAEGFVLEYRLSGTDPWVGLGEFGPEVRSYRHSGLVTGQVYEYRLAAWNEAGASAYTLRTGTPLELIAVLRDDFEFGANERMWHRINGGMAVDGGEGFDTGAALWFGADASVAETMGVDIREGGFLHYSLRAGNSDVDGEEYWVNVSGHRTMSLQFSTDGSSWTTLHNVALTYPNLKEWTTFAIALPPEVRSPTTRFRWTAAASSTEGNWAIDNIEVRAPEPPAVPWVDFVHASVMNTHTVHLSWPEVQPFGVLNPVDTQGVYRYRVERRIAGGLWEPIAIVESTSSPIFVDYLAPSGRTISYRVRTLAPWAESEPSLNVIVTTTSQLSEWRMINFGTSENSGSAADDAVDSYGVANIQRYAFGFDTGEPLRVYNEATGRPGMPAVGLNPDTGMLSVRFMRRAPGTNPEIEYVVEFSPDLVDWMPSDGPDEVMSVYANWEAVHFDQPSNGDLEDRCFARVRIVKP